MLTLDPYIPLALWFPLALCSAAALVAYGVTSRQRLARSRWLAVLALMLLAAAVPLGILLNPTWVEELPPPAGKPVLTILVDRSSSMATADAIGDATRYGAAVRAAHSASRRLADRFDIRVRACDATTVATDWQQLAQQAPRGAMTDLAEAIEGSLDELPQGQALWLLSDGIHNAGGGAARVRTSLEKARAMAAPVYTTTFGSAAGVVDLDVNLRLPQQLAFVGQTVPVDVAVTQRGALTDRARLTLLLEDKVVDEQEIALAPDSAAEATFLVQQAGSGLFRYEVRVAELSREVTSVNNAATLLLRVIQDPVRVLLLEGKPYWDSKFLLRTLSSDRSLELTSVVRTSADRFLRRDISRAVPRGAATGAVAKPDQPPQPAAAERNETWKILGSAQELFDGSAALAGYQIIVLGRDAEVFLDDSVLAALKRWLAEGGGALVCARGPPSSQINQRLGELMPVKWTPVKEKRFRVHWTQPGVALRWLPTAGGEDALLNLPSLAAVAEPDRPKPLAVVLAAASGAADEMGPVISYQPLGNGRVVVVEGAGMWRWAFLPAEHQSHEETYGLLWRSLVRWLVSSAGLLPAQQFALRSDKVTFGDTEPATATLLARRGEMGEPPPVELTGGGLAQPLELAPVPDGTAPGQFRVVFGRLPEGRYRARVLTGGDDDASTVTAFDVRGSLAERLEVAARPDLMQLIAQASGGAVLATDGAGELAAKFDEHRAATYPRRAMRLPAWDRGWVLAGVFGLWTLTWSLRRRSGLV